MFFQGSSRCSTCTCIHPMINNTWPNPRIELLYFSRCFHQRWNICISHKKCNDCYRKILILGGGVGGGVCGCSWILFAWFFVLFIYFNDILTLNIQRILINSKVLFVVPNTKTTIKNIVILDTLYPVTVIDVHHHSKFKSFCYESSATWNKIESWRKSYL